MRAFLFITALFLSTAGHSQGGFINVTDNDTFPESFGTNLAEVFASPASWKQLTVFAEYLDSADQYDFSKLSNLELLVVKYSFDPEKTDPERTEFVKKTNEELMKLGRLASCTKLKAIVFSIGEQIYLSDAERKKLQVNYNKKSAEQDERKRQQANLDNAWKSFGKSLQEKLPSVKMYAYDWGW